MVKPDYTPRLYDADGDLSKKWFIDYRIWDTDKGDFVRKRYEGMNKHQTLAARRKAAKDKLAEIKELIAAGFTAGKTASATVSLDMRTATVIEGVRYVRDAKYLRRGIEEYNRLLKRLAEFPAFGGLPLRYLNPLHAAGFMDFVAKRPKSNGAAIGELTDCEIAATFIT